jgi:hypothetical protein
MSGTPNGNKIPTHKLCATCHNDLPRSAYNYRKLVSGTVTLESSCRECHKRTAKASRERKKLERSIALAKVNPERRAKVSARRAKERRSPEERAARKAGWIRANGMCECGCGFPFGDYKLDKPEWHHPSTTSYTTHAGIWVRKRCHVKIEFEKFPHRHHQHRSYK